jgi:hypothetical protein
MRKIQVGDGFEGSFCGYDHDSQTIEAISKLLFKPTRTEQNSDGSWTHHFESVKVSEIIEETLNNGNNNSPTE